MRNGDGSISEALMEPANKRYNATACEAAHLPSRQIESDEALGTRVTLFHGPVYDRMTKRERINALYWHACLMFANGMSMNILSLRESFGLNSERKNKRYIPGWPRPIYHRLSNRGDSPNWQHYVQGFSLSNGKSLPIVANYYEPQRPFHSSN